MGLAGGDTGGRITMMLSLIDETWITGPRCCVMSMMRGFLDYNAVILMTRGSLKLDAKSG